MEKVWLNHYPPGVPATIDYPNKPLHSILDETAARLPGGTAVTFAGHTTGYGELQLYSDMLAGGLARLGVRRGDRVAIMMPNCPHFTISYFAILKAGAVVVAVNPIYVEREVEHVLRDSGAKVVLALDLMYPRVAAVQKNTAVEHVIVASFQEGQPGAPELPAGVHPFKAFIAGSQPLQERPAIDPKRDLASLQYTGGTTGVSKGAMLTHFNMLSNVVACRAWFAPAGLQFGGERILTILPLFHSYGMTCCQNFGVLIGANLVLIPRFDIDMVLDALDKLKPTMFPGVPTIYVAVNNHPRSKEIDFSALRGCNSGAAPLPVEVLEEFERKTGAIITEGYGLSECSPVTHCNTFGGLRKPGSVGIPYPDTECKIVDVETGMRELGPGEAGELAIRGPQVMQGYWNMPEETKNALREGWLYTGDIVKMDEDGFFYIVDRKKDMIIAGGFNIYPRDVEEVVYQHPAVLEACVAGVPDRYRGETVKAYIVRKPGANLAEDELIAFCRERLAAFKVPRIVEFRDSLPKTNIGKILRRTLVEEERRKQAAETA